MSDLELLPASPELKKKFAPQIAELVYATGPASYAYYFPDRSIFDAVVNASWMVEGTLFGHDATYLAVEGDVLFGIEIGFPGSQWLPRKAALGEVWGGLLSSGAVSDNAIATVLSRADAASWLNPVVPDDVYYVHALSVVPASRGRGVGMQLLQRALRAAQVEGYSGLHLDVLSDNPATEFYKVMGLELLVESRAPKPEAGGVPPEWRMALNFNS